MNHLRDDSEWHSAIQYKVGEQKIKPVESDATWDMDMFNALRRVEREDQHVALKHRATDVGAIDVSGPTVKIVREEPTCNSSVPLGLIWDHNNYSCAYDSLFTILYNIWTDSPRL